MSSALLSSCVPAGWGRPFTSRMSCVRVRNVFAVPQWASTQPQERLQDALSLLQSVLMEPHVSLTEDISTRVEALVKAFAADHVAGVQQSGNVYAGMRAASGLTPAASFVEATRGPQLRHVLAEKVGITSEQSRHSAHRSGGNHRSARNLHREATTKGSTHAESGAPVNRPMQARSRHKLSVLHGLAGNRSGVWLSQRPNCGWCCC